MKRKLRLGLAAIVVAALAMAALSGCDGWTVTFSWSSNQPYALVKNEAGVAIANVAVTLTGASTFNATTDSTGRASFTGFDGGDAGIYTLSATLAGYTFYSTSVTIGKTSIYLGTLVGYIPAVTTATITGTVTDARSTSSAGIEAVSVKLFAAGATTELATATTDTNGAFTFATVDPGRYKLTAAKTGYAFIDKTFDLTQIDATVDVGTVLGFASSADDIAIIAVWSPGFADVDSYITYPSADQWVGSTNPSLTLLDPYSGADDVSNELTGFFPGDLALTGREVVYHLSANRESTGVYSDFYGGTDTRPAITLDRDDTDGAGPETITIIAPPMPGSSAKLGKTTKGSSSNGLPYASTSSDDYSWIGVMEYFVDAFTPASLSTEGVSGGSELEVYIVQGSAVKGHFTVPDYIAIGTASILRINVFVAEDDATPVYQFLPDIRIAEYSGIRSVAGAPEGLVLYGAAR